MQVDDEERGLAMTGQPKFKRRKKRVSEEATPRTKTVHALSDPAAREKPKAPATTKLEALLAEKEALLKRKAELETRRLRAEVASAEAELEARQSEFVEKPGSGSKVPSTENASEPAKPVAAPLVLGEAHSVKAMPLPPYDSEVAWTHLDRFHLNADLLSRHNVITALRENQAHTRFDILRTRMPKESPDSCR